MILNTELFSFENSIAGDLIKSKTYPWEVLPEISDYIKELGSKLDPEEFENPYENVWIAKDAVVFPTAYINGPCIIDHGAEVRHCAFIRGSAIVGKNAVVGNSTELKNCILFDGVQVPHYNYVGDSILGYKAHMAAGSITSNLKSDKKPVIIRDSENIIETNMRKVGAFLGDFVEVGCNSVMNPGSIIGKGTMIYPLSSVRGVIADNCICKTGGVICERDLR